MKKEYYRIIAVVEPADGLQDTFDQDNHRVVSVDRKKNRAYVTCNVSEGYAEPAVALPRRAKYHQITLSLKQRNNVETIIVNKATGDILKPFHVTKEGVAKYAFGQTYLRGAARENWVISVWGNGRIVVDDVSLPIRGGKTLFNLVSGIINETFHVYLGEEFLERELQKLPDYMVQVIGPILSAYQELEKRGEIGGTNAMTSAFKQALEEGIDKVLGAGKAASAKKN